MPLTDVEVQRVAEWLKERGVRGACTSCGRTEWALIDVVTAPVSLPAGAESNERVPVVVTACSNCGHVVLYSAVMIGIR
jgi:predicted nucleic-acid-binding Zn-ribbon protein